MEKLANYVASGRPLPDYYPTYCFPTLSYSDVVHQVRALTFYDAQKGSTNADLRLRAEAAGRVLVPEIRFTSSSDPPVTVTRPWDAVAVADPTPEVVFRVEGTGEASFTFGLELVPSEVCAPPGPQAAPRCVPPGGTEAPHRCLLHRSYVGERDGLTLWERRSRPLVVQKRCSLRPK